MLASHSYRLFLGIAHRRAVAAASSKATVNGLLGSQVPIAMTTAATAAATAAAAQPQARRLWTMATTQPNRLAIAITSPSLSALSLPRTAAAAVAAASFSSSANKTRFNWPYPQSPYQVLGVDKLATKAEIKRAYFKEAKKHHPDLNPNNPRANEMFAKLAHAYEILSNDESRQHFDMFGSSYQHYNQGQGQSQSYGHGQGQGQGQGFYGGFYGGRGFEQYTYQQAEQIFKTVMEDKDIIKVALQSYYKELEAEFTYALECTRRSDWRELGEVLKAHKGLIFGVTLPLIVLLRSPAAFVMSLRALSFGSQFLVIGLISTGKLPQAVQWVWNKIKTLAEERNRREQEKSSNNNNNNNNNRSSYY